MHKAYSQSLSILLLCLGGVALIALQMQVIGYIVLAGCAVSLVFAERVFAKDIWLILVSILILGVTRVDTDTSVVHMLQMGALLMAAVAIPYLVSRFYYGDHAVRFPWKHGRFWYKSEVAYIVVAGGIAYVLLPFYLQNTGAYLNWPSAADAGSLVRLFVGTNALGVWDELFFVTTVLGLLRRHFSFGAANIFQAILFTSFLYELGFTGWGPAMIFAFALLQGYIFKRTESLLYIVTIHLTVDCVLFLALIHAHHPSMMPIFMLA